MSVISHKHFESYSNACNEISSRIGDDKNLVNIYNQLKGSEFGRFLIENRGLDAYWTDVVVNFHSYTPEQKKSLSSLDL